MIVEDKWLYQRIDELEKENEILREGLERLSVIDTHPFQLQLATIWAIALEALHRAKGEDR